MAENSISPYFTPFQTLYEVSIPYDPIAPLCELPIPRGIGNSLFWRFARITIRILILEVHFLDHPIKLYPDETIRCFSIESLPLGFVRDEETAEELSPP